MGVELSDLEFVLQAIKGVPRIEEGINPATWMLEVSTPGAEARTSADFAASYKSSEFARCALNVPFQHSVIAHPQGLFRDLELFYNEWLAYQSLM